MIGNAGVKSHPHLPCHKYEYPSELGKAKESQVRSYNFVVEKQVSLPKSVMRKGHFFPACHANMGKNGVLGPYI